MHIRTEYSRVLPILLTLTLTLGLTLAATFATQTPTVAAHAKYESSVPAADSTVTQAPTAVTIHFAEDLNPAGSDIVVYDTTGKVVSTAKAQVNTSDPKTMTVPMTGTNAESYLVAWHNVSLDDGDAAIGAFTFNVGEEASQPTPATSGDAATPSSGASGAGVPGWVVALVGILGLIIGSGGTLLFAGRKSRA